MTRLEERFLALPVICFFAPRRHVSGGASCASSVRVRDPVQGPVSCSPIELNRHYIRESPVVDSASTLLCVSNEWLDWVADKMPKNYRMQWFSPSTLLDCAISQQSYCIRDGNPWQLAMLSVHPSWLVQCLVLGSGSYGGRVRYNLRRRSPLVWAPRNFLKVVKQLVTLCVRADAARRLQVL